jgi:hypothetical protein
VCEREVTHIVHLNEDARLPSESITEYVSTYLPTTTVLVSQPLTETRCDKSPSLASNALIEQHAEREQSRMKIINMKFQERRRP